MKFSFKKDKNLPPALEFITMSIFNSIEGTTTPFVVLRSGEKLPPATEVSIIDFSATNGCNLLKVNGVGITKFPYKFSKTNELVISLCNTITEQETQVRLFPYWDTMDIPVINGVNTTINNTLDLTTENLTLNENPVVIRQATSFRINSIQSDGNGDEVYINGVKTELPFVFNTLKDSEKSIFKITTRNPKRNIYSNPFILEIVGASETIPDISSITGRLDNEKFILSKKDFPVTVSKEYKEVHFDDCWVLNGKKSLHLDGDIFSLIANRTVCPIPGTSLFLYDIYFYVQNNYNGKRSKTYKVINNSKNNVYRAYTDQIGKD